MSLDWIMNVPVLSTAHLPSLDPFDMRFFSAEYAHGGFVYVGDDPQDWEDEPWFQKIIAWASQRGYEWIRFDADGDIVDGLPIYDW